MSGMRRPKCQHGWLSPASGSDPETAHFCGERAMHIGRHKCRYCPATKKWDER